MHFTKLQGAGNDYIYVNGLSDERDWPGIARLVSDRHFGIGADGLIVVAPSAQADVRMRMFNADGSEGEMCGNGIRCLAKYVLERQMVPASPSVLNVETGAGVLAIIPHWHDGRIIGARVDMGAPILVSQDIPVDPSKLGASARGNLDSALLIGLELDFEDLVFDAPLPIVVPGGIDQNFVVTAVSMGNPHVVAFMDEPVDGLDLGNLGPMVENHEAFPNRINFHVVNVISRSLLVTRTWERGSGLTLACGTGAGAMVVAARLHGLVDNVVSVQVPGGALTITWPGKGSVLMDGDAVEVFSGEFPDDSSSQCQLV